MTILGWIWAVLATTVSSAPVLGTRSRLSQKAPVVYGEPVGSRTSFVVTSKLCIIVMAGLAGTQNTRSALTYKRPMIDISRVPHTPARPIIYFSPDIDSNLCFPSLLPFYWICSLRCHCPQWNGCRDAWLLQGCHEALHRILRK
jgi:hypothetical protein